MATTTLRARNTARFAMLEDIPGIEASFSEFVPAPMTRSERNLLKKGKLSQKDVDARLAQRTKEQNDRIDERTRTFDFEQSSLFTHEGARKKLITAGRESAPKGTTNELQLAQYGLHSLAGGNVLEDFDIFKLERELFGDIDDQGKSTPYYNRLYDIYGAGQGLSNLATAKRDEDRAFAGAQTRIVQGSRERAGQLQRTDEQRFRPRTRQRQRSAGLLGDTESFGIDRTTSLLG